MPVFLERFVLPICAALMIGVILLNPLKMDPQQRISLAACVLALAYFVGNSLHKSKPPVQEQPAPVVQTPSVPSSGDAITNGDNSPAVSGNGNNFDYGSPPQKKDKVSAGGKSRP
jgi:hypothetical protein